MANGGERSNNEYNSVIPVLPPEVKIDVPKAKSPKTDTDLIKGTGVLLQEKLSTLESLKLTFRSANRTFGLPDDFGFAGFGDKLKF